VIQHAASYADGFENRREWEKVVHTIKQEMTRTEPNQETMTGTTSKRVNGVLETK
jgi:hypothetical protein